MNTLNLPDDTLVTDIRAALDRLGLGARYSRRGAIDCVPARRDVSQDRGAPRTIGQAAARRLEELAQAARGVKPLPAAAEACVWSADDDGLWWSGCQHPLALRNAGGPLRNDYAFCPFCGKPIRALPE
jgi:hypothetical protein